ncbi:hypothetical protein K491DRAFT_750399 [Lophiostoma macrostomum CBS 122681]|uniref:Uncharacterized protein n=1 Tax=Lophiostoma macrostomum CBS 122681 TaxID=1314788 RepID=A0A6A6T5J1_9PLEO|nr:hypothetical protein K491DRAFT_750399 [Lophiostoma macrostomum CBS 122681]
MSDAMFCAGLSLTNVYAINYPTTQSYRAYPINYPTTHTYPAYPYPNHDDTEKDLDALLYTPHPHYPSRSTSSSRYTRLSASDQLRRYLLAVPSSPLYSTLSASSSSDPVTLSAAEKSSLLQLSHMVRRFRYDMQVRSTSTSTSSTNTSELKHIITTIVKPARELGVGENVALDVIASYADSDEEGEREGEQKEMNDMQKLIGHQKRRKRTLWDRLKAMVTKKKTALRQK